MTFLSRPTPSTYKSRGWIPGSHRGDDWGFLLANPTETQKILASADGEVITAYAGSDYNGGWGRRIRIRHAGGAVTTYNHMRAGGVHVSVGQHVVAGQHIGDMGESGSASGRHLHHELEINGVRVDPAPYYSKHLPGTGGGSQPAGNIAKLDLGNENWFWYRSAADAEAHRNAQGAGGRMLTGSYQVFERSAGGAFRVRSKQNGDVWLSPKAASKAVGGAAPAKPAAAPAPAKRAHVRIGEPWFVYNTEHEAYHAQNKRGTVPAGTYLITDYGNDGKPVQIEAPGQAGVRNAGRYWIGSANTAAPVVWV